MLLILGQSVGQSKKLLDSAQALYTKNPSTTLTLAQATLVDASANNDVYGLVRANLIIGYVYMKSDQIPDAIIRFLESIELAKNVQDSATRHYQLYSYLNLGLIFKEHNAFDLAMSSYLDGLILSREMNKAGEELSFLWNIESLLRDQGNYDSSLAINRQIIRLSKDYPFDELGALNGMGIAFQEMGNLDSAMFYYQELHHRAKSYNDQMMISFALHNIGDVYFNMNNFEEAKFYYNKSAQEKIESSQSSESLYETYRDLTKAQIALNEFNAAKMSLDFAASYLEGVSACVDCKMKMESVYSLYYRAIGDPAKEAYHLSLYQEEAREFEREQERIQYTNRQAELRLIVDKYYSELEAERREAASRNLFLSIILGITLLFGLFATYHFYTKYRARRLIDRELEKLLVEDYN
jgi:tetratricopeptide (TPR) repeat protein